MRGEKFEVSNGHHDLDVARICKDHKKTEPVCLLS